MLRNRICSSPPRTARTHVAVPALLALTVLFGTVRPASAQSPTAVAELVDLRFKLREQQARVDVGKWELSTVGGTRLPDGSPQEVLQKLVAAALAGAQTKMPRAAGGGPNADLVAAWRDAEARRVEFQSAVAAREDEYGFSFADRTPPPFRLTPFDIAVLGWAAVAFAVGCSLASHERRVSLRRSSRSRLPGGVAAAVAVGLLTLGGCRGTDPASRKPAESPQSVRDATAQAEAEADDLTRQMNGRHDGQIAAWAKFISGDPTRQKGVREADAEVLARVRAAAVTAALEDRLADDILTAANLEAEQKKLNEMTSEAVWWSAGYAGARVAVACVLGLVVAAPFWIARRRTAAEKRKSAQTCPRCLETGKLKVLKTDPKGKGEYKESTFVECKACEYRIARSHQQIARLCFPTVGIRASGKTHMLTTAYSAIKSGTTPTRAAVKTAPSVMDERFRQYIDLILRHRGEAGATVHDAEHLDPLLIHVRDTDRWGPSGVLVNLFDYSGELLEQTPLAESLGPRAMLMDGFMLFFDPTQIYGDTGVNLQDQVQALNDFYERMATERGLDPGTIIPNPVAVCITKFDLLETHNPIGGMCLDMIQQLDGPLKPGDGEAVTLAMLKARSDLVEQMLPLMLPGVDLRRLVREHFGTQMMFFPMSSVNLNLDEFGRVDPADRNPAPYGVVEPILWLLHMHGYRVLDAN